MYPLKHKLILSIFLTITLITLAYFLLKGFSLLDSRPDYIHSVVPYIFIVSAAAIALAPIIIGANGHWLLLVISCVIISIVSLGTGRYVYNMQSMVLMGLAVNVHIFSRKNSQALKKSSTSIEEAEESTNILKSQLLKTQALNSALSGRLESYRSLREVGESFSARLSLEEIYRLAVDTAYSMIPKPDATLLFIVDEAHQKLELSASRTKTQLPRIKSKAGDIFDQWVFKERQPLNVEDVDEDFRFDYKPLEKERPFSSLISVPLISQSRIAGVLRVNSCEKAAYTFDDLRLLDFISDMVSSAINNARLYNVTEELSTKDSLTGFYIHRYLKTRLAEEIERSRVNKQPLSIIMFDIDHFKDYNDKYGHSAGDKVLLGISKIMRESVCNGYIIARYGGEEFVMVLANTDIKAATGLAEEIRKNISRYEFMLRRKQTGVTVSAGIAAYSDEIKDTEELLKRADFRLYKAKKEGRNRVCAA